MTDKPSYILLLIISGLAAILGTQIRSLFDFIGHACYLKDLDVKVWWPYFTLRPILGFLIGIVIIILSDAQIYTPSIEGPEPNIFFLGIAILGGFGANDVFKRLRLLSKSLFGAEN